MGNAAPLRGHADGRTSPVFSSSGSPPASPFSSAAPQQDWDVLAKFPPSRRASPSAESASTASTITKESRSPSSFSSSSSFNADLSSLQFICVLGKGSFGKVFLARNSARNELVAVKVMRKDRLLKSGKVDQALGELETLKRLCSARYHCPFICPLRFACHSPSKLFLVFDYLPGGELFYHLNRRGRMPDSLVRFYASEIVLALGTLHSLNIVFRDLKPENIVFDRFGHVNLVDFGLSICLDEANPVIEKCAGTTSYMSPEALSSEAIQPAPHNLRQILALDWWSFGVLLFEMLTGLPPWHSDDKETVIKGILEADVAELDFSEMSPAARSMICACLERDPSKRLGAAVGTRQVTSHPFFKGVDWVKVAKRAYDPPFVPPSEEEMPGQRNFDCKPAKPLTFADLAPCPPGDVFDGFSFRPSVQQPP